MTIDLKTVKHISKLARISLEEKKAEKLADDMNSIFEFIEKLNELKTDNVCLLYTSPSPRDRVLSRMPSSA